jgi:hypothetical protein
VLPFSQSPYLCDAEIFCVARAWRIGYSRMAFRDSFDPFLFGLALRRCDAFGYFVETELTGRLTAVSLLSAIVAKSDDCAVLRIVLTRAVAAKAGAPEQPDLNAGRP